MTQAPASGRRFSNRGPRLALAVAFTASAIAALAACRGPLDRSGADAVRDQLIAEQRQRLADMADGGLITLTRDESDVEQKLTPQRLEQLDRMSGPTAYDDDDLDPGADLLGQEDADTVSIGLQRAIDLAVEHNLALRVARLRPKVSAEQVIRAEAIFESVLFADLTYENLDTPQPPGVVPGLSGDTQSDNLFVTTGITKRFSPGTVATVSTSFARQKRVPSLFGVPSFYTADLFLEVDQPLLRGFGSGVNEAEIRLAENAQAADVEALKLELLSLALRVEQAYWGLYTARQNLLIQSALLRRTIEVRDVLGKRAQFDFDVTPVTVTEANSFVELQRADVIRARETLRRSSDLLKRLMSAPQFPVSGETLLLPATDPARDAIEFSLLDAVLTALRARPELERALLQIADADIRRRLADDATLPILDLTAGVRLNGLDTDDLGGAYSETVEADYIDYLLGARFERSISNDGAEAAARQARLLRRQAVLAYQDSAELATIEVKDALRRLQTNYELIGATRAARRAAAENLREIQVLEDKQVALTPTFILDRKLPTLQRLALAELEETEAVSNYNTALAEFFRATGELLDRRGVEIADDAGKGG